MKILENLLGKKEPEEIIYNVETYVRENSGNAPKDIYDVSKKIFEDSGIVGKFHVSNFGRLYKGFDESCEETLKGGFDIYYRDHPSFGNLTLKQIINNQKLITSGFDEQKQEMLELGEQVADLLEIGDFKSVILPWKDYSDLPHYYSFEVDTPLGWQSAHIHLDTNHEIIQFFKPKNDEWWNFDVFKSYVFWHDLQELDIKEKFKFSNMPLIKDIKNALDFRGKRIEIYKNKLMHGKYDSIEKIIL